jgi:hypothetical protein
MLPTVYLSRRNLQTLLNKLDRKARGEETACTIDKNRQTSGYYQQTMSTLRVIAVDDDEYYSSQQRLPGDVHPSDDPNA